MKYSLITLLIFTSTTLHAQQWTQVATDVQGIAYSFDWSTLRKEGNLTRIWALENLPEKKPSMLLSDSTSVFSYRYRMEFDCKNERQKILSFSSFSEKDAGGKVISRNDFPAPPADVPPGTVAWLLMETACKAKHH